MLSWLQIKFCAETGLRRAARPHRIAARFHGPLVLRIPHSELPLWNKEVHGSALPRLQLNPRKTLERALRRLDAADIRPHVELHHFIADLIAGIRHVDADTNVAVAARRRWLSGQPIIPEGGIAQSESKGKKWLSVAVDILPDPRGIGIIEIGQ